MGKQYPSLYTDVYKRQMMGSLIINIDEKDLQAVENDLDQEKITWEEIV